MIPSNYHFKLISKNWIATTAAAFYTSSFVNFSFSLSLLFSRVLFNRPSLLIFNSCFNFHSFSFLFNTCTSTENKFPSFAYVFCVTIWKLNKWYWLTGFCIIVNCVYMSIIRNKRWIKRKKMDYMNVWMCIVESSVCIVKRLSFEDTEIAENWTSLCFSYAFINNKMRRLVYISTL